MKKVTIFRVPNSEKPQPNASNEGFARKFSLTSPDLIEKSKVPVISEQGKFREEEVVEEEKKKMQQVIDQEELLFKTTTVFPFILFPDTITVTKDRVTITNELFFLSQDIRSVLVKDIARVEATTGIFFGKLEIVDKYFTQEPIQVTFLWKKEALKARRIIQGLMVSDKAGINTINLPTENLRRGLEYIGQAHV